MPEDYNPERNSYRGIPIEYIETMFLLCVREGVDFSNQVAIKSYLNGYEKGYSDAMAECKQAIINQVKEFRNAQQPF